MTFEYINEKSPKLAKGRSSPLALCSQHTSGAGECSLFGCVEPVRPSPWVKLSARAYMGEHILLPQSRHKRYVPRHGNKRDTNTPLEGNLTFPGPTTTNQVNTIHPYYTSDWEQTKGWPGKRNRTPEQGGTHRREAPTTYRISPFSRATHLGSCLFRDQPKRKSRHPDFSYRQKRWSSQVTPYFP